MKKIYYIILFLTLFIPLINAQEQNSSQEAFAIELLYKHFDSHYTPKDILHKAKREAGYIANEFKKGKEAGLKALGEFNQPFTRWNQMDGLHPFSHIFDTVNGAIVAHPNPALSKLLNRENLLLEYKDHAGRLIGVEAIEKLKLKPKGTWIFQYTTWIKSKTKIASPLYVLNALVMIPETKYFILVVMPYRGYSIEEMNKTVDYLDSMVEHWSILN